MKPDILLLILAAIFFGASLYFFLKKKSTASLLLLILGGCLIRVYLSLDPYLHLWDEQFHAVVAKHLLLHPLVPTLYDQPLISMDYKVWWESNVWLHKPPLALWLIALSLKIFGVNTFALRIPSIVFSTIAIYLTYLIGKILFNEKVGWLAAFFQAINGFVIEITAGRIATDHVDVSFFFFIELAILFAVLQKKTQRKVFIFPLAFAVACAIYSKWLPALIVIPIWWVLNFEKSKLKNSLLQLFTISLIIFLLVLPWQIYIFKTFPQEAWWESLYNWKHLTTILDQQGGPWYYFIQRATVMWNELIWVAFIWFVWKAYKTNWRKEYLALIIWITIPYIFFSSIQTKMMGYVLFTGPAFFLILSCSWFDWLELSKRRSQWKWFFRVITSAVIILSLRYCVERIKPGYRDEEKIKLTDEIKKAGVTMTDKSAVVFTPNSLDFIFFTSLIAYNRIPTDDQVDDLYSKGYKLYIIDNGNVPERLRENPKISLYKY